MAASPRGRRARPERDILAARVEVDRAIFTFSVAAEEAVRIGGEYLPLDWQSSTAGRWGIVRRFPLGPIAAITPFNFPINLVAHKLAPAIAAGFDPDLDGGDIAAIGLLIGLVHHHALGKHAGERLIQADMTGRLHRPGKETAVKQMQNRVLDTADILVHRHQAVGHRSRGRRVLVPRIGETCEIP